MDSHVVIRKGKAVFVVFNSCYASWHFLKFCFIYDFFLFLVSREWVEAWKLRFYLLYLGPSFHKFFEIFSRWTMSYSTKSTNSARKHAWRTQAAWANYTILRWSSIEGCLNNMRLLLSSFRPPWIDFPHRPAGRQVPFKLFFHLCPFLLLLSSYLEWWWCSLFWRVFLTQLIFLLAFSASIFFSFLAYLTFLYKYWLYALVF